MSIRQSMLTWRPGRKVLAGIFLAATGLVLVPSALVAQSSSTDFVLNTFAFLVWGALVMWMCAGFTMLESGSVRSKNASVICLKNIGLYAIAGLMYFIIGFNLMYVDVDSFLGSIELFYNPSPAEVSLLGGDNSAEGAVLGQDFSKMSNWFFQMVFVATTASIVSGALAERVRLWAFFAFTALLTAVIYPVVGAWTWGGGWLAGMGFSDFAGSTIVHSTGGWAALAGIMVVGPRWGKFRKDGSVKPTPPSNVPIVTLGVFILWLGWFGFNGGSQLALAGTLNAVAMSNILVNTNLAAAAGVVTAIFVSRPILGRTDLFAALNGAIAGLVAITADPTMNNPVWAVLIGAVGALICTLAMKLLEAKRLDDVVGAVPAHLFAGAWGTIAVALNGSGNGTIGVQLIGVMAVGAFVFSVSWIVWTLLSYTIGCRVSRQVEEIGQDATELGLDAYPDFVLMVDPDEGNDYRDV